MPERYSAALPRLCDCTYCADVDGPLASVNTTTVRTGSVGRHSQSSSLRTTAVGLGVLVQKGLTSSASPARGRRRAERAPRSVISPTMYRAGGVAAALALAVSGGAYAAVQATGPDARPMTESQARLQDLADNSAPDVDDSASAADESPEVPVEGDQSSMTTVTEDVTDAHTSTQEETDSLPQGQTQVKTAGVDGVSRVTYQVTMRDGQEVSREAVSSVVVTQRVDEVVLVGTGDATAPSASPAAASSAPAAETAAAASPAGTIRPRTPPPAPMAFRRPCPGRRWTRSARTGAPTPPLRSSGGSATSPAATARPAPPGRTRRRTAGTDRRRRPADRSAGPGRKDARRGPSAMLRPLRCPLLRRGGPPQEYAAAPAAPVRADRPTARAAVSHARYGFEPVRPHVLEIRPAIMLLATDVPRCERDDPWHALCPLRCCYA